MCRHALITDTTLPVATRKALIHNLALLQFPEDGVQSTAHGAYTSQSFCRASRPYAAGVPTLFLLTVEQESILGVHLRKASTGTAQTLNEAHPFTFGDFLFAHNGYFAGTTLHPGEAGRPQSDSYEAGRKLHELMLAATPAEITPELINQWLGHFNDTTSFACVITQDDRIFALRNAARDLWYSRVGNGYILATSITALRTLKETASVLYGVTLEEPQQVAENTLYTFFTNVEEGTRIETAALSYTFKVWKNAAVPVQSLAHGWDDDDYYGRSPYVGKGGASSPSSGISFPKGNALDRLRHWQADRSEGKAAPETHPTQGSSSSKAGTPTGTTPVSLSGGVTIPSPNGTRVLTVTEQMEEASKKHDERRTFGSFVANITAEQVVRAGVRGFVSKLSPLRKSFIIPLLLDRSGLWPTMPRQTWDNALSTLTFKDFSDLRETLFKGSELILPFTKEQRRLIDTWNRTVPSEIEYVFQQQFFTKRWFWDNADELESALEFISWDYTTYSSSLKSV